MESVINSTNKDYPFSKFDHTMRMKDLFQSYDTKLIKVEPGQGHAIRRVLGPNSNSTRTRIAHQVFLYAMKKIIDGVVGREFIFKLPFKNLDVKMKVITQSRNHSRGLFNYYRGVFDPMRLGFEMNRMVLEVTYPKRPQVKISMHLSTNYYAKMLDNKMKNLTYENGKVAVLEDIALSIRKEYPQLQLSSIRSIIRHGLNVIFRGLTYRCDSYVNLDTTNDKFFVYFSGTKNKSQYVNVRKKVRFLMMNKKGKDKHEGYYYFSLSDARMEKFNKGETVVGNCTRYIEELLACKNYSQNIYRIKIEDCYKYAFFQDINKDNDNAKYIYRWVNNGFESIDNT